MFKSILRFVGLCLFLIFTSGNVWADTLSSSDPCYGKYYTGPGGGSISCNYENNMGKCFQVSRGVCEFWCKSSNYFRAVDNGSITSSSQITSDMAWTCQGGTYLTGSCGTQKTSYDGQTYYKNESYLDCRKTIGIGYDVPALAGQSSAYVEFKVNPDFSACPSGPSGCSYAFDVKANKPWNPYILNNSYPSWVYSSRGYRCGAGTRINSSAQLCVSGSSVGRISGSSCSTSSSVLSAQPYCTACANGTYNSSYTTSTSCTRVPDNSTSNTDHTDFLCNAGYYKIGSGCGACPWDAAIPTGNVTSPVGATNPSQCYYPGSSGASQTDSTGTYTYGGNCNFDSNTPSEYVMQASFLHCNNWITLLQGSDGNQGACYRACVAWGNSGQGLGDCVNTCLEHMGELCQFSDNYTSMTCTFSNNPGYYDSNFQMYMGVLTHLPADAMCSETSFNTWPD